MAKASVDTAEALHSAARDYELLKLDPKVSDSSPKLSKAQATLQEAASEHLKGARDLEEVKAEYDELQEKHSSGEDFDVARYHEVMAELGPVRKAVAILDGALPGTLPVVTAEQNGEGS